MIAAEGGGIQSAAWTAEVVSRLERDLRKDFPDFKERIALISGVSGGAVGAMHLGGVLVQIGTPK